MTGEYWVSGVQGTGFVEVKDKIIVRACPLFRQFVGYSFFSLANWLKDVEWKRLGEMKKIKLRGQVVEIDTINKVIHMEIKKPTKKSFSISDKIAEYVLRGFSIKVKIGEKIQVITDMSKAFKEEVVSSKFAGYDPWHRYWFFIEDETENRSESERFW